MQRIIKWFLQLPKVKKGLLIGTSLSIATFLIWPLHEPSYAYSTVLNDRDGNLLGASIAEDGQWRFPEPDSIPSKVSLCIQYFEDRHFYNHPGVNPLSIGRALWQNLTRGEIVSGASTITMQIARMMRTERRTFRQKVIEMLMALKLELKYSKSELMTKYLAMAPFGGNVVGIEAASWRYFNRPSYLLSWGEAASLAVLPNNPGAIFPGRSKEKFQEKRDRLLQVLVRSHVIDSTTYELSLLEALPGKPFPIPQKASHLLATVEKETPGEIIHSTLDPFWQNRVFSIVERHQQRQSANGVENLCALVVDLKNGQVLAYIGNTNNPQADGNRVDVIQKPRSPGSSMKPILYAHALDKGEILPKTLLPDIPTFFGGYSPKNFSLGYDGAVPADKALAKSLNIPFTYLLKDHSFEQFHADLKRIGFTTLNQPPGHYGLSLILGGGEVTLWDLSSAYVKMFHSLSGVNAKDVSFTKDPIQVPKLRLDPAAIWHTFNAMTELSRPDGENNWRSFSSSQLIAWKTGTSFGFRDAWAIGLNGEIFVGVWVGNADGEGRAGLTGINSAAPLFHEIMRLSDHNRNWLNKLKPLMNRMKVCTVSGMLASRLCPSVPMEVPIQAENSGVCPYHVEYFMNGDLTHRVNSSCYSPSLAKTQTHFVLPPAIRNYYAKSHASYIGIPPLHPTCISDEKNPIEIIYPNPGSTIFLPKTLEKDQNKVILEASHQSDDAVLFWNIGQKFYGKTEVDHKLEAFLSKGTYTLKVTDRKGNEALRTFEVLNDPQ